MDRRTNMQAPCPACGQPPQACRCNGEATIAMSASASAAPDSDIGAIIGERYELVDRLGSGGMGTVFKAKHVTLPKFFAIKILNRQLSNDAGFRARFDQEARTASLLNNAHLVSIYDHGTTAQGEAYLVMDFIDGKSLAEVLAALKRIEEKQAIKIFIQICEGLSHAHGLGVIHRDLKPGNIMLINTKESRDFVKVVDFGIAKMVGPDGAVAQNTQSLTKTGEFFGSPLYTSPEQGTGAKPDQRSDIYSLGVLMYECLTSVPPFKGENFFATMVMHNEAQPRPFDPALNVHTELEEIVFKCLQKNPDQRYQSMDELKGALQGISKSTDSRRAGTDAKNLSHKKTALVALCALTLVLGGASALWLLNFASHLPKAKQTINEPATISAQNTVATTDSAALSEYSKAHASNSDAFSLPAIPASVRLPEADKKLSAGELNSKGKELMQILKAKGDVTSLLPARYFTSAIEVEPGLNDSYDNLSGYYWETQNGVAPADQKVVLGKCLQVYKVQLKQFPKNAEAYGNMATILVGLSRYREALESSEKAIALQPSHVEYHLKRAYDLHCLHRWEEAIAEYEEWLRPSDRGDLYVLGTCYQDSGQHKEALAFANRWLKKIGPEPGVIIVKADAEKDLGMYKEALADFTLWRKLAKNPGDTRLDAIAECRQRLQTRD